MYKVQVFQPKSRLLTATDAPVLLYWVNSLLDAGFKVLVIDLQGVSFMDSSGLGSLVIAHTRAQKVSARLVLCAVSGQTRMILEMSGFDKVFETCDAIAQLENSLLVDV